MKIDPDSYFSPQPEEAAIPVGKGDNGEIIMAVYVDQETGRASLKEDGSDSFDLLPLTPEKMDMFERHIRSLGIPEDHVAATTMRLMFEGYLPSAAEIAAKKLMETVANQTGSVLTPDTLIVNITSVSFFLGAISERLRTANKIVARQMACVAINWRVWMRAAQHVVGIYHEFLSASLAGKSDPSLRLKVAEAALKVHRGGEA